MYINGQWTQAENNAVFDVFNPATGEGIAEYLETKLGEFSV